MIKDFTPRLYQQTILNTAAQQNTLVILPTGLGKTALAFLLAAHRLQLYPQSKILMLAPTKPLCEQHRQTFQKHLEMPPEKIALFTGSVSPEKRAALWKVSTIVISTPQGLENDVINQRVRLEEVSLLIIDEAHHATGDYAYVWLAQQYDQRCSYPRVLALTASPGSEVETMTEICQNLNIRKVEVRTERDEDVKPYVQPVAIEWVKVPFPEEFKKIQRLLQECLRNKLTEVKQYGYCKSVECSKTELLALQSELQQKISREGKDFEMLRSMSLLAEALKIEYALELLETQGIKPLASYCQKLQGEAVIATTKAVKNLVVDELFKSAICLTEEAIKNNFEHPKLPKVRNLVENSLRQHNHAKIIVFTQIRNSAEEIVAELNKIKAKSHIFVGQAKKNGLGFSQKKQKEVLEQFKSGEFNVLVATSVAEEGLDIPKVDQVIFFEPVPSAIRTIQRRGRTGRLEEGRVIILLTAGTRDEGYRWSALHKEKRMYSHLEKLKTMLLEDKTGGPERKGAAKEKNLLDFIVPNDQEQIVAVLADHREKGNRTIKELIELGVSVKTAQLETADYIVSGTVGVELKTVPDFVSSIIDGRILEQMRHLKQAFEKTLLIIEGEEDIFSVRKVHENAIRGMITAIALDFRVPILYTKNARDTAGLLAVMARREQDRGRDFSYPERKPQLLHEQQEFFIASIPGIGFAHARQLLSHYGSIKKLITTTKEELMSIEGVGEKTAERLLNMFNEEYKKRINFSS